MAVRSGLAGSLGIAPEVTFGTYVAPTRFYETNKSGLKKQKNIAQGGGLAAGRMVQPSTRRVLTAEDAAGDIEVEVTHKDMGVLLQQIFGTSVTPVLQGAGPAMLQTHTLADNVGKFTSIQVGTPEASGTVRPYTYQGSKPLSAEFKCGGPGELLMVTIGFDSRQASEVPSLAAVSYTAGLKPFHFGQMGVKLGTFGAEAAVDGIKGMSLKFERPQAADRFYANNAGLKSEHLMNDWVKITGTFNADFVDKTILADRFAADSSTALVWEFIGPTINATFKETFRLKVPVIYLDDTHAGMLDGPGVVTGDVPFTGLFDLTNAAITCEYISTDTVV